VGRPEEANGIDPREEADQRQDTSLKEEVKPQGDEGDEPEGRRQVRGGKRARRRWRARE
jgi:hypothetical protein